VGEFSGPITNNFFTCALTDYSSELWNDDTPLVYNVYSHCM